MSCRANSDQLIPVNHGINRRNTAFALIVLAFGLLFVSSPVLSVCGPTNYAGPPVKHWRVPQGDTTMYAMRFSPVATDTLKAVSICLHDEGDGSWGNDTIAIAIYSDDGFGLPGTVLATEKVVPGGYSPYPSKTSVSFASLNLVFNSDFHVVVSTSAQVGSGRYESILSDSGATGVGRSSFYHQGVWGKTWADSATNFLIEVYCCRTCYATGDVNGDGLSLTLADVTYLVRYLNGSGPAPVTPYQGDLNGDCVIDTLDAKVYQSYFTYGMSVFIPYGGYPVATCCSPYVPGDANGDGSTDVSDAVYLIGYIFAGGPAPNPLPAGDANCDGAVDISDAVYMIQYIFVGGPPPCHV